MQPDAVSRVGVNHVASIAMVIGALGPAAGVRAQCCGEWELRSQLGPAARVDVAMAYDSNREVVVLFGGSQSHFSGEFGDTWEWDGTTWRLVAEDGPPPRSSHSMVYDSDRGVVLMFGGRIPYGDVYEDTWQWDGVQWTQVADTGPSKRFGTTMAYDTNRHVAVLYGGYSGTLSRKDTWEWDGQEWTRIDNDGPRVTYFHVMAFDEMRNETVMFTGGQTFGWNGSSWTQRASDGPAGRTKAAMVYDSRRGRSLLYAGYNDFPDRLGDTWEWDGERWTRVSLAGPKGRSGHAMAYDAARGETLTFGGERFRQVFSDTWAFGGCEGRIHLRPLYSACPGGGAGAVSWACGTPGGQVRLLYADRIGAYRIPTGPCVGIRLTLSSDRLRFVASGVSGADGRGEITVQHGSQVCGGAIQLLDVDTCTISNVAIVN